MEISKYVDLINKTAIYPKHMGLAYCMLGLTGEFGEFIYSLNYNEEKENQKAENGDVYWYLVALCTEFNRPELFENSINLAKNYIKEKNPKSVSEHMAQFFALNSKLCEMVKKHYRDGREFIPELIDVLLGSLIMNVYVLAYMHKLDFDEVLDYNYAKLIDRKEQRDKKGLGTLS